MRQKAGGHRAVIDRVVCWAGLHDEAAFKDEGIGVLVARQMSGIG